MASRIARPCAQLRARARRYAPVRAATRPRAQRSVGSLQVGPTGQLFVLHTRCHLSMARTQSFPSWHSTSLILSQRSALAATCTHVPPAETSNFFNNARRDMQT
jgi:hypothetical protein